MFTFSEKQKSKKLGERSAIRTEFGYSLECCVKTQISERFEHCIVDLTYILFWESMAHLLEDWKHRLSKLAWFTQKYLNWASIKKKESCSFSVWHKEAVKRFFFQSHNKYTYPICAWTENRTKLRGFYWSSYCSQNNESNRISSGNWSFVYLAFQHMLFRWFRSVGICRRLFWQ